MIDGRKADQVATIDANDVAFCVMATQREAEEAMRMATVATDDIELRESGLPYAPCMVVVYRDIGDATCAKVVTRTGSALASVLGKDWRAESAKMAALAAWRLLRITRKSRESLPKELLPGGRKPTPSHTTPRLTPLATDAFGTCAKLADSPAGNTKHHHRLHQRLQDDMRRASDQLMRVTDVTTSARLICAEDKALCTSLALACDHAATQRHSLDRVAWPATAAAAANAAQVATAFLERRTHDYVTGRIDQPWLAPDPVIAKLLCEW